MSRLLKGSEFDDFLLREGLVTTYMEYRFSGRLHTEYFDAAGQEEKAGREYALWSEVKPFFLELIKGKRTPLVISLDLLLSDEKTMALFRSADVSPREGEQIKFGLQLRFEHGAARLVTGVSRNIFSMDRTPEEAWDAGVKKLLHGMGIPVEEE